MGADQNSLLNQLAEGRANISSLRELLASLHTEFQARVEENREKFVNPQDKEQFNEAKEKLQKNLTEYAEAVEYLKHLAEKDNATIEDILAQL